MRREQASQQAEFNHISDRYDTIILCGPKSCFSDCVQRTIEAEFTEHSAFFIDSYQKIDCDFLSNLGKVSVIVFHDSAYKEILQNSLNVEEMFPNQTKVLAYDDCNLTNECWEKCSQFFDSFLPMDARVDVWLSIIRLILAGGVYVPPSLKDAQFEAKLSTGVHRNDVNIDPMDHKSESTKLRENDQESCGFDHLTKRENEVLKLVADGLQNKNIASEFGLSEHTVKLHVHNVIVKLRVANRTEAAAMFLREQSMGSQIAAH